MIINKEYNFIFVHVPKTGGNSVKAAICGEPFKTGMHKRLKQIPLDARKGKITFGFVRNPWDRTVSMYHFRAQKPVHKRFNQQYLKTAGFKKALLDNQIGPNQNIDQLRWLKEVDYVLRFERFEEELDRICEIIGITHKPVEKLNASRHEDYHNYYDEECVNHVTKYHKRTIEKFGYTF